MIAKVAYFLFFLAAYGGWLATVSKLKQPDDADRGHPRARSLALAVLTPAFVLAMIWPLTRQFDVSVLLILAAVGAGSNVLAQLAIRLLTDRREYEAHIAWMVNSMWLRHAVGATVAGVASMLAVLAFPVVVGVFYFLNSVPTDAFTTLSIRLVLLFIVGADVALVSVFFATGLTSDALDNRSRDCLLAVSLVYLIPGAVWLSVLVRLGDDHLARAIGTAVILGYTVVAALLPYVIGRRRAAALSDRLHHIRRASIVELRTALLEPLDDPERVAALHRQAGRLTSEITRRGRDPDVALALAIISGNREWAFGVMALGRDPYRPGTRILDPAWRWIQARYDQLVAAFPLVRSSLLRVEHVTSVLKDRERIDRLLRAYGDPGLSDEPTVDVVDVARDPAAEPAALGQGAPSGDDAEPTVRELEPLCSDADAEAVDVADPRTAREGYAALVQLELDELDTRRTDAAGATRLVSLAAGALGSITISIMSDVLGSAIIDVARGFFVA